jgi:tetratricopeptide (TPR) repeat protein
MTMKTLGAMRWYFVALLALGTLSAASGDLGAISGVVRDAAGKPVAGAKVTLTGDQTIQKTDHATDGQTAGRQMLRLETLSDSEGRYRFSGLAHGQYTIHAELGRLATITPVTLVVSASFLSVTTDLALMQPQSQEVAATVPPHSPLKFEAAGVRGLIDPGGYSASANAAAASGLIAGIVDIKRSGNGLGARSEKDWPCSLEPELRKAVEKTPDSPDANRRLGEFYIVHDVPARAVPFLQRARSMEPANGVISEDLAVALIKSGQFDSARELLISLAEGQPTPQMYRLLARADEGSGQFTQASHEYQLAANADPSEENLFGVGYELILAGSPAEAANAFRAGAKLYPKSIALLIGIGAAKFLQGQTADSLLLFLQATDLDPTDPRPYSFLSSASTVSPVESDRVRSRLKRFLDLAPDNPQASYLYGLNLLEGRGKQPSAFDINGIMALFQRAIVLDPNFARAHYQLGVLHAEHGDYNDAVREYEAAVRLAPDLKEAHYRLAGAYRHTGHPELASHEMQLFQQIRDREDRGISIEQFVSVLGRSEAGRTEASRAGQQGMPDAPCPSPTADN